MTGKEPERDKIKRGKNVTFQEKGDMRKTGRTVTCKEGKEHDMKKKGRAMKCRRRVRECHEKEKKDRDV